MLLEINKILSLCELKKLTYLELLGVFDISFTTGTNVIDNNSEYYII